VTQFAGLCGNLRGHQPERIGPAPPLVTWLVVGSVPNGVADAPYTGADVRADAFPGTPGAPFGSLAFVGATRPA